MQTVTIQTQKKDEVIDITGMVSEKIGQGKIHAGICVIFVLHTTCCISTADLDPGTDLDLLDALRSILPRLNYRHPHNPNHTPDHILSSIIGPSVSIPLVKGKLVLGTWQRIVLIELDGPRERELIINCIPSI